MGNSDWYTEYFVIPADDKSLITTASDPCGPGKAIIDGLVPLNQWPCGMCMKDGKKHLMFFAHWYEKGEDQDPFFAQIKEKPLIAGHKCFIGKGFEDIPAAVKEVKADCCVAKCNLGLVSYSFKGAK